MTTRALVLRSTLVGGVFVVALVASTLLAFQGAAQGQAEEQPLPPGVHENGVVVPPVQQDKPDYPTNAAGQTYGPGESGVFDYNWPDLVRVLSEEGKEGYVYREQLVAPMPTSPEDAALISEAFEGERTLEVYEADGVTVIGTFIMNRGARNLSD